jgi:hypothetical protein
VSGIETKLALTATQTRLLRERADGVGPQPLVAAVELDGVVDGDRLDRAWQELQRRHPFLRLRLDADGARSSDEVRPLIRANLPGSRPTFCIDVAKILAAAAREKDLSREGPAEAVWIRTGPEASLLICSVDHVASDGFAFGLMAREWSSLYQGQKLPECPDPVITERYQRLGSREACEAASCDLLQEFEGARAFSLPHSTTGWAFQQVDLPLEAMEGIRRRAARERSTAFALGLAVVGRAIGMEYGTDDLIVSTHVANRSIPLSERVVCATYSTVPMRVSSPHPNELEPWTQSAKKAVLRALNRQQLPFSEAREALAPQIPPEALLRVMVNFDEHAFLRFTLPGVEICEAVAWKQGRIGTGLNAPVFSTSPRPWPAGITISFRETWECLQLYVHYGAEIGNRGGTMLLGRVAEGIALLTNSN